MKKIISSYYTFLIEIVIIILAIIWYIQTKDIEPIIVIIIAVGGLITSTITRNTNRPKLVLQHIKSGTMRLHNGYSNIQVQEAFQVGIDSPNVHWELKWIYDLEIRNNSSYTAYYIVIEYENLPPKTRIVGSIGKLEPITANSNKKFEITLQQYFHGTHLEADEYLVNNEHVLTKDFNIVLKYRNEDDVNYKTIFNWKNNNWVIK